MSSLVEIIYALTQTRARMPVELPRGLHLVYYPPTGDQPCRLIAARYLSAPSPTELRVVRESLIHALDANPALVLEDITDEWQETSRGDWEGYEITWHMLSSAGAFSHDHDLRRRVRLAIERREQRQLKRREQQRSKKRRTAANGPRLI